MYAFWHSVLLQMLANACSFFEVWPAFARYVLLFFEHQALCSCHKALCLLLRQSAHDR
jgi:hypothetical protein